jgi:hypothetical protein
MEFGRIFYFVPVFEVLKDDGLMELKYLCYRGVRTAGRHRRVN